MPLLNGLQWDYGTRLSYRRRGHRLGSVLVHEVCCDGGVCVCVLVKCNFWSEAAWLGLKRHEMKRLIR